MPSRRDGDHAGGFPAPTSANRRRAPPLDAEAEARLSGRRDRVLPRDVVARHRRERVGGPRPSVIPAERRPLPVITPSGTARRCSSASISRIPAKQASAVMDLRVIGAR
jgi:hypothetical protein